MSNKRVKVKNEMEVGEEEEEIKSPRKNEESLSSK